MSAKHTHANHATYAVSYHRGLAQLDVVVISGRLRACRRATAFAVMQLKSRRGANRESVFATRLNMEVVSLQYTARVIMRSNSRISSR